MLGSECGERAMIHTRELLTGQRQQALACAVVRQSNTIPVAGKHPVLCQNSALLK